MTTLANPIIVRYPPDATFREETITSAGRLRAAMVSCISGMNASIQKSRDVQDALGVNLILSWQVHRIINASDAFEMCLSIPGAGPMRKLLTALKKHGAGLDHLEEIEAAYQAFEEHVATHGGDRTTFDAMVTRLLGGDSDAQAELSHRKAMFEAQRYLIGVEMDASSVADILVPSRDHPGMFDCAYLRMRRNLRRLSAKSELQIGQRRYATLPGESTDPAQSEPLDPAAFAKFSIPIMPEFCSTTDLQLKQQTVDGTTTVMWAGDGIGLSAAIDVSFGEIRRKLSMAPRPENRQGFSTAYWFVKPLRLFTRDLLVHRSAIGRLEATVTRWAEATMQPVQFDSADTMKLPQVACNDQLSFMGSGASALYLREVPRYASALKFAIDRLGFHLEDFDVYRLRIEYPFLFTVTHMNVTFLESDRWAPPPATS